MLYKAPKHVTAIHTGAGSHYIADKDGVIEVPEGAPTGDHVSLCSAGWTPLEAKKAKGSSALGELRAEYQAVFGKKPAPNLNADALAAKIAEHKAAQAEPPAGDA